MQQCIDNFDNEHYSTYTSLLTSGGAYSIEYYVKYRSYKKYKKLTGMVSPYEDLEEAEVRIILDDKTRGTYKIGKKTDPIQFEFDISDVDYIRFEVTLRWHSGVIISDVAVSN